LKQRGGRGWKKREAAAEGNRLGQNGDSNKKKEGGESKKRSKGIKDQNSFQLDCGGGGGLKGGGQGGGGDFEIVSLKEEFEGGGGDPGEGDKTMKSRNKMGKDFRYEKQGGENSLHFELVQGPTPEGERRT